MDETMDPKSPAEDAARRLLRADPSRLAIADVRELQALLEGCVEALGLIRAQTWQLLNALKVPHDTPFAEILRQARALRAERPTASQRVTIHEVIHEALQRYEAAPPSGKIVAVLRYGIATGVAVERGDVEVEGLRQGDDSTPPG